MEKMSYEERLAEASYWCEHGNRLAAQTERAIKMYSPSTILHMGDISRDKVCADAQFNVGQIEVAIDYARQYRPGYLADRLEERLERIKETGRHLL